MFGMILELFLLIVLIFVVWNLLHFAATKAKFDPFCLSKWLSGRKASDEK